MSCVVGAGMAVAQITTSPAQGSGAAAVQTARNLADLRASLSTLNIILVDFAQAVTPVQRQQLLTEGSQLIRTDLALINALGGPCMQGGPAVSQPAPPLPNGSVSIPQGTPVPPSLGAPPFPFSGGTIPAP